MLPNLLNPASEEPRRGASHFEVEAPQYASEAHLHIVELALHELAVFADAAGAGFTAWAGKAHCAALPMRKKAILACNWSAWLDRASDVVDISSAAPALFWITLSSCWMAWFT